MKKEQKKKHHFRHLNQLHRDRIEALLKTGHKQREIAKILGFNPGTISREIKKRRPRNGVYKATTAQYKAGIKRLNSKYQGMKIEKYPKIREEIIRGLQKSRSPDEIAGRMKREKQFPRVGANAIYKWLYSGWGQMYCHLLCTKRYRKRKQKKLPKREMIKDRVSLLKRPKKGIHAEGDLFVSPIKSGTKRSGALICVPESMLMVGTMIENKKPRTMAGAVKMKVKTISVDDLTMDNGIENKDHKEFGLPTYFCDPHSPWQKPHVENSIGLLRRWFIPKKTDLRNVSEEQLQYYLHILNDKYRKSLGYRSAYEVSLERGIIQKRPVFDGINGVKKVAFH